MDTPALRKRLIAQRLSAGETVVAATLAREFGVSSDAIRRDLRALAAEGYCQRVYGGALPSIDATSTVNQGEIGRDRMRALARAAVGGIAPQEIVFLDSGRMNLAIVEFLPLDKNMTIVTNSVLIAAVALQRSGLRIVMIGGTVDPVVGGCIDAAAVLEVAALRIDTCFLGVCAVSVTEGIGATDHRDAAFKRALLASSRRSVILATSEDLGASSPFRIAEISAVDCVVVEDGTSFKMTAELLNAGVQVVRAPGAS